MSGDEASLALLRKQQVAVGKSDFLEVGKILVWGEKSLELRHFVREGWGADRNNGCEELAEGNGFQKH